MTPSLFMLFRGQTSYCVDPLIGQKCAKGATVVEHDKSAEVIPDN